MEFKNTPSPSTDLVQKATTNQGFNSMFNDDCQYFDANIPDQQQNFHEDLTGKVDDCQYFVANIPDRQQNYHEDLTGKDAMMDSSGFGTFNTSNSFDNSDHSQVNNCNILNVAYER